MTAARLNRAVLDWRPLAPFGAEVSADLSAPLSEAEGAFLRELLWQHGVVRVRGQALDMARQREICGLLGPILIRQGEGEALSNASGHPAVVSPLSWHADAAYTDAPFDAIALHALDVVDDASSTRFVDVAAGLARLPEGLRVRLDGATLEMISPGMDRLAGRTCDAPDPVALKRGVYPAVRVNPHNGRRVLWASELQTAGVVGMDWAEGRDLLNAVFAVLYDPAHVLELHWRKGDLVIWDNIGTQHARGNLSECGTRVLQRVIVGTAGVIPTIPDQVA
ncbi:MAG: TauD/TfdA family dioxygenase [Sphingomonadales bacterium]|nr:TauD/TfdA family dioxygenase [Sphingomonadales bacterium]